MEGFCTPRDVIDEAYLVALLIAAAKPLTGSEALSILLTPKPELAPEVARLIDETCRRRLASAAHTPDSR